MEQRNLQMQDIQTRNDEDSKNLYLEGYFAKFGDVYEVWDGVTESIHSGAFTDSINGDIRALYNHNTDFILGRTTNGTLELRQDEVGLWGRITLNPKDTEAMNVYERIARGDITGCSFGFEIEKEERTVSDNGDVHFEILKVNPLYEISVTPFPAYESTYVEARGKELADIKKRELEVWKAQMLQRIKGEQDGIKSIDDEEAA